MLRITPCPDFDRFLDTLLLRKTYRRPPMFDFHVAIEHKTRLLGRAVHTPADEVEFFLRAGYDYVQCTVHVFCQELIDATAEAHHRASTVGSNLNLITSLEQYRSRRWSWQEAAEGNLRGLESRLDWLAEVVRALPPRMKIILHGADVFTYAWQLIGFEQFCMKSIDDPELIAALMQSLAAAQLNAARAAAKVAGGALGAIFYSDDIAHCGGLMLAPGFFRRFLLPVMEEFAQIGRQFGAPMIYHSDGRLYDVLDDLAAIGVRAIQPLEPKSMDPLEIQQRWPGRFCLLGNIDLDVMARGTADEVESHVRQKIARIGAHGGYMPGVSNTVPNYVKFENYVRMIETVHAMGEGEGK